MRHTENRRMLQGQTLKRITPSSTIFMGVRTGNTELKIMDILGEF